MASSYIRRARSYTDTQKRAIIEYMRKNPNLRSAKFSASFTHTVARSKWIELTNNLNKMRGPKKNFKEWRKTWQDLKSRTKIKANRIKEMHCNDEITVMDKEILQLISLSENVSDPLEIKVENNEDSSTDAVEIRIEEVKQIDNYDFGYSDEIQLHTPHAVIETTLNTNTTNNNATQTLETDVNISTVSNRAIQLELVSKNELLKDYYTKKLVLAERVALAQERRAFAVERIATAQELMASNKCQCNCVKNNKVINLDL